jgi:hypothetical protein
MPNKDEPELMYKMANYFVSDFATIIQILEDYKYGR